MHLQYDKYKYPTKKFIENINIILNREYIFRFDNLKQIIS